MKEKIKKNLTIGIGIIFIFLTFFILYRIVPMTLDGWAAKSSYAGSGSFIGFLKSVIIDLYTTCNGRITSNIICGILESFTSEIPLDIFNALIMVAIYFLLYLIYGNRNKINRKTFLFGSFLFVALVLYISSNMRSEVLFYANTAYLVPIPLSFLYYYLFRKYDKERKKSYLYWMILLGVTIGMWMEHIAAGFAGIVTLMTLILIFRKHKNRWKIAIPAIFTDISFVIMMLAPGLRANRNIISEAPMIQVIINNLKTLYVDIISTNILVYIVMFALLFLVVIHKKKKNIFNYAYMIVILAMETLMITTIYYRNFGTKAIDIIDNLFPTQSYLAVGKYAIIMTIIFLTIIIFGILQIREDKKKLPKDELIYTTLLGLTSLVPMLITPNMGPRISSIGFFTFSCLTVLIYFELMSKELKINKTVNIVIVVLVLLALDRTILLERRIYTTTNERDRILTNIKHSQEMSTWDYNEYAFLPIYYPGDMQQNGAVSQATIHYVVMLDAYGLDQRTKLIFSNHKVSAVQGIRVYNDELTIKTNITNRELIKYKIYYGSAYGKPALSWEIIDETDWIKEDYKAKIIGGYYILDVSYKSDPNGEVINEQYQIVIS